MRSSSCSGFTASLDAGFPTKVKQSELSVDTSRALINVRSYVLLLYLAIRSNPFMAIIGPRRISGMSLKVHLLMLHYMQAALTYSISSVDPHARFVCSMLTYGRDCTYACAACLR